MNVVATLSQLSCDVAAVPQIDSLQSRSIGPNPLRKLADDLLRAYLPLMRGHSREVKLVIMVRCTSLNNVRPIHLLPMNDFQDYRRVIPGLDEF